MYIYKVTQGLVEVGKHDMYMPRESYHRTYDLALAARREHGGESTKYEDCQDVDFCFREIWIERNIPLDQWAKLLCTNLPRNNYHAVITRLEVEE